MTQDTTVPKTPSKNILVRFFTDLPVFFPLIALFHLGMTAFEAFNYLGDYSVAQIYWLRPGVLLLYTVFWTAACFLKKWGGIAYIALTIANVSFHLFGPDIVLKRALGDLLFAPIPINLVFSFLLLFFFRKMK